MNETKISDFKRRKLKPCSQQRGVAVRKITMLRAYAKVVNSIAHLNDEERRRVMKAANITCGEAA